jgi:hypothetical protein
MRYVVLDRVSVATVISNGEGYATNLVLQVFILPLRGSQWIYWIAATRLALLRFV